MLYEDLAPRPIEISQASAVLSLDLETDYASGKTDGLKGIEALTALLEKNQVKATVFVEGSLIERSPDLVRNMDSGPFDLQLHCRDHQKPGDTPESIQDSARLYRDLLGRDPLGYRADTYRINPELLNALKNSGFKWDSSILPAAFGYGANTDKRWRAHGGYYWAEQYGLFEFPVAAMRRPSIPVTHAYYCLLHSAFAHHLLRFAHIPRLFVYDMHMVDLVNCTKNLDGARVPSSAKKIYKLLWKRNKQDTFNHLQTLINTLQTRGYLFTTLSELYKEACRNGSG